MLNKPPIEVGKAVFTPHVCGIEPPYPQHPSLESRLKTRAKPALAVYPGTIVRPPTFTTILGEPRSPYVWWGLAHVLCKGVWLLTTQWADHLSEANQLPKVAALERCRGGGLVASAHVYRRLVGCRRPTG